MSRKLISVMLVLCSLGSSIQSMEQKNIKKPTKFRKLLTIKTKKSTSATNQTLEDLFSQLCEAAGNNILKGNKDIIPKNLHLDSQQDENGFTIFHLAACYDQVEVLEYLALSYPLWSYLTTRNTHLTLLHVAAQKGNLKMVKYLLSKLSPQQVNAQDSAGNTPLHLALESGHLELVQNLLEAGAQSNATNRASQTPLHLLLSKGNQLLEVNEIKSKIGLIRRLVAANPTLIAMVDNEGNTPIHRAVIINDFVSFNALLHCDLHNALLISNESGLTPAALAVQLKRELMVAKLLTFVPIISRASNGEPFIGPGVPFGSVLPEAFESSSSRRHGSKPATAIQPKAWITGLGLGILGFFGGKKAYDYITGNSELPKQKEKVI